MPKTSQRTLAAQIGKTIASRRNKAGLTQEEVAERLGIGNEAVSRLERGVAMLTVVRLFELAEMFDCETTDLLTAASAHVDDQARHLSQMLRSLSQPDRQLMMSMMEQLSSRLAHNR